MILSILTFFLYCLTLTTDNSSELCMKLCSDNYVNLEQDIVKPFNSYLSSINIEGNSEMDLYLNYMRYLSGNDAEHELLNSSSQDYLYLQQSLQKLGLLGEEYVEYEPLIRIVKKIRPKTAVTKDFKKIFQQLKKYNYNVSAGLTASGITMALTDHDMNIEQYRDLVILTIAPYAIMR